MTEADAQQLLLDALLTGSPLPGIAEPLVLPDVLDLAEEDRGLVLVDERGASALEVPAHVRVVGRDAVAGAALANPSSAVLEFLPPEDFPDTVGVRLQIAVLDRAGRLAPLGEVIATFRDLDGPRAVDPTHVLAY